MNRAEEAELTVIVEVAEDLFGPVEISKPWFLKSRDQV